jgi:translation initiation factor 3 subunit L
MYTLLAMCLVLHPQCVDESIQQVLREKNYTDRMFKMQYGDLQEFENCFQLACPKFLSMDPAEDSVKEAVKYQTAVFMSEVKQQKMLPTIRRYISYQIIYFFQLNYLFPLLDDIMVFKNLIII